MKIEIKYSTTWEDISSFVDSESIQRTQKLHNKLKATVNMLKFQVKGNVSLMNAITNSNTVYVRVFEDDGTTYYFYGKVKNSHKIKVEERVKGLAIDVTDLSYLLKKELEQDYYFTNIKVYNSADPANSLIHQLVLLTEYSIGNLPAQLMDIDISYLFIASGKSVDALINEILNSYGYTYNVESDGTMKFYPFVSDTITPSIFLSNGNMLGKLEYKKNEAQVKSSTVEWKQIFSEEQRLIVSDVSNSDASNKCNIQIAPEDYYPVESNTSDVKVDFTYLDYELLKVENVTLDIEKDSDVIVNRFDVHDSFAYISLHNTNSVLPKYVTKLDIYGDVHYRKKDININHAENGEAVEKTETIQGDFIFEKQYASQLAQWRANFWKYADWEYSTKSKVKISIGDFVSLTDTSMGASTNTQCIEVKDKCDGIYEYKLIGVSEYQILPNEVEELNFTPPPAVQKVPIDVNVDGYVEDKVYYVRETITGAESEYTTIPSVPVISEVISHFKGIEIVWNKQINLTGFKEYQLQVSFNQTDWYELGVSGDWKNGGVDGYTALSYPRHIHIPIPFNGTADSPTAPILYYRVRQRTESDLYSEWSAVVSGSPSLIESVDIPANSISANKVSSTFIDTITAQVQDNIVIDNVAWSSEKNNTRAYLDENQIAIQKKDSSLEWKNVSSLGYDNEYSGRIKLGEHIELKTGSKNSPEVGSTWYRIFDDRYYIYNVAQSFTINEYNELETTFIAPMVDTQHEYQTKKIMKSSDGDNWTQIEVSSTNQSNHSYNNQAPIYVNGAWYLIESSTNGKDFKSTDNGETWAEMTRPYSTKWPFPLIQYWYYDVNRKVYYEFNNKHYYCDNSYRVVSTSDFESYTTQFGLNDDFYVNFIRVFNNRIVAVGYEPIRDNEGNLISQEFCYRFSVDGENWTKTTSPVLDGADTKEVLALSYSESGKYFMVAGNRGGNNQCLLYSYDLITWTMIYDATPDFKFGYYNNIYTFGRYIFFEGKGYVDGTLPSDRKIKFMYSDDYGETFKHFNMPLYNDTPDSTSSSYLINDIQVINETFLVSVNEVINDELKYSVYSSTDLENWLRLYTFDEEYHFYNCTGYVFGLCQNDLTTNADTRVSSTVADKSDDLHISNTGGKVYINGQDLATIGTPSSSSSLINYQYTSDSFAVSTTWSDGWITDYFYVPAKSVFNLNFSIPYRSFGSSIQWGSLYVRPYVQINEDGNWISLGSSGFDGGVLGADNYYTYTKDIIQDFSKKEETFTVRYKFQFKTYDGTASINTSHEVEPNDLNEEHKWFYPSMKITSFSGVTGARGFRGLQGERGFQGDKGEKGNPGAYAIPFVYGDTHNKDEGVIYNNTIYICNTDNTNNEYPDISPAYDLYSVLSEIESYKQLVDDNNAYVQDLNETVSLNNIYTQDVESRITNIVEDDWHYIGEIGEPQFENGWVDYGQSWGRPRFRKDLSGAVFMEGLIKGGTSGSTMFVLPEGYRPTTPNDNGLHFTVAGSDNDTKATLLYIDQNGLVHNGVNDSNSWISLCCSFSTGSSSLEGLKGEKGDAGTQGGSWSAGIYNQNDIVSHNGSLWRVDAINTTDEPSNLTSDWIDILKGSSLLTYQKDTTTRTFSTTPSDGWITESFTIPAGAVIETEFSIPARNDSSSWGGGYTGVYYELNGDGNWKCLGDSGYDTAVMHSGSPSIATYSNEFIQDFSNTTTPNQIRYKFRHRSYDGTTTINASHNIDGLFAPTEGNGYAWTHLITKQLNGITGPKGDKGERGISAEGYLGDNLPIGTILMFDANTPIEIDGITVNSGIAGEWVDNVSMPGWYACVDGNQDKGCPNLVAKFVMGKVLAGTGVNSGANTITLTVANLPSHTHSITHDHGNYDMNSQGNHRHGISAYAGSGYGSVGHNKSPYNTVYSGYSTHNHDVNLPSFSGTSGSTGSGTAFDNRPAHYSIIYIRKCS